MGAKLVGLTINLSICRQYSASREQHIYNEKLMSKRLIKYVKKWDCKLMKGKQNIWKLEDHGIKSYRRVFKGRFQQFRERIKIQKSAQ